MEQQAARAVAWVLEAMRETNTRRQPDRQMHCAPDAILYGQGGQMDSLELVTFIVDLEDVIAERTGRTVTLADERAMSQARSPFRTAGSLAAYIEGALAE